MLFRSRSTEQSPVQKTDHSRARRYLSNPSRLGQHFAGNLDAQSHYKRDSLRQQTISEPSDRFENEADRVAKAAIDPKSSNIRIAESAQFSASRVAPPMTSSTEVQWALGLPSTEGGRSLPSTMRSKIEPVVGANLDNVRLHSGQPAEDLARRLQARAFSYREHVWLGQGQREDDLELVAHEVTHTLQHGAPTIQRWKWPWESEKPIKARRGLKNMFAAIGPKLQLALKQAARKELDAKIIEIAQQGKRVSDINNKIGILEYFIGSEKWDEADDKKLAGLRVEFKTELFKLSELKERAVKLATIAYDIDTSKVSNTIVEGFEEDQTQQAKAPVYGTTENQGVTLYHGAFKSSAWLGSTLGHEAEVHAYQQAEGRDYDDDVGFILNEIEARDYELQEAKRYGMSPAEIAESRAARDEEIEKLRRLDPSYVERVRNGNYSLK